jgi:hypothetical protein
MVLCTYGWSRSRRGCKSDLLQFDTTRRLWKLMDSNNGKADLGVRMKPAITKVNGFPFLYPREESCILTLYVLNLEGVNVWYSS